jgi:hypothetical protein
MQDWLKAEPPLHEIDLRPYFFFSRDTLGPLGIAIQRLTPAAQDALAKLLNESEAVRKLATQHAVDLNQAEAAAVFEALADKVQAEEDLSDERSSFGQLFGWVNARPELMGQLMATLKRIASTKIPLNTPMRLLGLSAIAKAEHLVNDLLNHWKQSGNANLVKAADNALKRSNRRA